MGTYGEQNARILSSVKKGGFIILTYNRKLEGGATLQGVSSGQSQYQDEHFVV